MSNKKLELIKQLLEVNNKMDRIIEIEGRIPRTYPLFVEYKSILRKLKSCK